MDFFYWAGCIFSQSTLTEVGISLLKHFRFQSTLRVFSINFLTKVLISWCTSIYSIWIHEGIKMGCNNIHKFKKYEKRIIFFLFFNLTIFDNLVKRPGKNIHGCVVKNIRICSFVPTYNSTIWNIHGHLLLS